MASEAVSGDRSEELGRQRLARSLSARGFSEPEAGSTNHGVMFMSATYVVKNFFCSTYASKSRFQSTHSEGQMNRVIGGAGL